MQPNFDPNIQQEKSSIKIYQANLDEFYEQVIDSQVEGFLEEDSYYQMQATPLKSAATVKEEHKRQIKEELEQKELRNHITHAYELIMNQLPHLIEATEFEKLKEEFANSIDHFNSMETKSQTSLQEVAGISDASLKHIYSLANVLVQDKQYKDAESLLNFLILLNPAIPFFWTALGATLQGQSKYEESTAFFQIAQTLDPTDPESFIMGAFSDSQLNHQEEAKKQLAIAEEILANSTLENKEELTKQIQFIKNKLF